MRWCSECGRSFEPQVVNMEPGCFEQLGQFVEIEAVDRFGVESGAGEFRIETRCLVAVKGNAIDDHNRPARTEGAGKFFEDRLQWHKVMEHGTQREVIDRARLKRQTTSVGAHEDSAWVRSTRSIKDGDVEIDADCLRAAPGAAHEALPAAQLDVKQLSFGYGHLPIVPRTFPSEWPLTVVPIADGCDAFWRSEICAPSERDPRCLSSGALQELECDEEQRESATLEPLVARD